LPWSEPRLFAVVRGSELRPFAAETETVSHESGADAELRELRLCCMAIRSEIEGHAELHLYVAVG
jgi:hypothetical protein